MEEAEFIKLIDALIIENGMVEDYSWLGGRDWTSS